MSLTLHDFNTGLIKPVHQPVCVVNPTAPAVPVFEAFRFANPLVPIPYNIFEQQIDTFYRFSIRILPK
jgi:hypothetical protein